MEWQALVKRNSRVELSSDDDKKLEAATRQQYQTARNQLNKKHIEFWLENRRKYNSMGNHPYLVKLENDAVQQVSKKVKQLQNALTTYMATHAEPPVKLELLLQEKDSLGLQGLNHTKDVWGRYILYAVERDNNKQPCVYVWTINRFIEGSTRQSDIIGYRLPVNIIRTRNALATQAALCDQASALLNNLKAHNVETANILLRDWSAQYQAFEGAMKEYDVSRDQHFTMMSDSYKVLPTAIDRLKQAHLDLWNRDPSLHSQLTKNELFTIGFHHLETLME